VLSAAFIVKKASRSKFLSSGSVITVRPDVSMQLSSDLWIELTPSTGGLCSRWEVFLLPLELRLFYQGFFVFIFVLSMGGFVLGGDCSLM
jgi:hypothetical protein